MNGRAHSRSRRISPPVAHSYSADALWHLDFDEYYTFTFDRQHTLQLLNPLGHVPNRMDSGVQTASSAGGTDSFRSRLKDGLFLEADRRLVAVGIVAVFVVVLGSLVSAGMIAVGVGSSVANAFGSGLTSGVVTLVTIAVSINQLILSRVFGSAGTLADRLGGSRDLRARVEESAGQPSSPNDPAAFLSLLAVTLSEHAETALSIVERSDPHPPGELTAALTDIAEYGRVIDSQVEDGTPITDSLGVILGPEYAINIAAVRHLRNEYGEDLSADAQTELGALDELLESVAVIRQFFKTLALQQDFAILSRQLIYSGLLALLVSVSVTLVYRTDVTMIAPPELAVVVPVALGVVVAPIALFAAYILRAATVANRTVSVGPFVPPAER